MQPLFFLLIIFIPISCSEFQNSDNICKELEGAVALGEFLNIPDQAYNNADSELLAFFNFSSNADELTSMANNQITDGGTSFVRVLFNDAEGILYDNGKIKTDSQIGAQITTPSMNESRFETIAEIVNSALEENRTHGKRLIKDGRKIRIYLTHQERDVLGTFMNTLTNQAFINDPNLAYP